MVTTTSSANGRPANWTPIGKPSGDCPAGTATTGSPVRLKGAVVRTYTSVTPSSRPSNRKERWSDCAAVAGSVGQQGVEPRLLEGPSHRRPQQCPEPLSAQVMRGWEKGARFEKGTHVVSDQSGAGPREFLVIG